MDIQKLKELAEKATQGDWTVDVDPESENWANQWPNIFSESGEIVGTEGFYGDRDVCMSNAEFVASACPQTILELLDELESLRSERTAWRVTAENAEKQLEDLKTSKPVAEWVNSEFAFQALVPTSSIKDGTLLYALLEKTNAE